jgi:putative FmdB family regulatory protein
MPLYDYKCRQCGHTFEALVRPGSTAACRSCGSPDVEQLLSSFAVSSDGTHKAHVASARKNAENTRSAKRHTEHEYMRKHLHDDH